METTNSISNKIESFFRVFYGDTDSDNLLLIRVFPIRGRPTHEHFRHTAYEFNLAAEYIEKHKDKADIYFGVNTRSTTGGKKADVGAINVLHADIDFKHKHVGDLQGANRLLRGYELRPTFVVGTGNGVHAYWKLAQPTQRDQIEYIENLMRRLYIRLGGLDNVQNVDRILRVPFTYNYKQDTKKQVKLLYTNLENVYTLEDIENSSIPGFSTDDNTSLVEAAPASVKGVLEKLEYVFKSPEWQRNGKFSYNDYRALLVNIRSLLDLSTAIQLISNSPLRIENRLGQDITHIVLPKFTPPKRVDGTLTRMALQGGWKPKGIFAGLAKPETVPDWYDDKTQIVTYADHFKIVKEIRRLNREWLEQNIM